MRQNASTRRTVFSAARCSSNEERIGERCRSVASSTAESDECDSWSLMGVRSGSVGAAAAASEANDEVLAAPKAMRNCLSHSEWSCCVDLRTAFLRAAAIEELVANAATRELQRDFGRNEWMRNLQLTRRELAKACF